MLPPTDQGHAAAPIVPPELMAALENMDGQHECWACRKFKPAGDFQLNALMNFKSRPALMVCAACRDAKYAATSTIQKQINNKRSAIRWSQRRLTELQAKIAEANESTNFTAQIYLKQHKRELAETEAALAKHQAALAALIAQRDAAV